MYEIGLSNFGKSIFCEDCVFYAENIIKNTELVQFLSSLGVDAQKADEAWCKMEKDGFKYFSVDYFRLYSEMEGTFKFDNVIVEIGPTLDREKEQPTHWMGIEFTEILMYGV